MDSNSSLDLGSETLDRMNRLLDRILDRVCVPFLGAGISFNAKAPDDEGITTKSGIMADALFEELRKGITDNTSAEETRKILCDTLDDLCSVDSSYKEINGQSILSFKRRKIRKLIKAKLRASGKGAKRSSPFRIRTNRKLMRARLCKRKKASERSIPLSTVAELAWSVLGPENTCEILKLGDWQKLVPTKAHRYLAFLAREGLIDEVLETNYDSLVERAFDDTFDRSETKESDRRCVICDLETYRSYGAKRDPDRLPVLKVVKLAGCAENYKKKCSSSDEEEKRAAAEEIVLTETQLQKWRSRQWARDLLRDRLRSRSLLFIGFGSQDRWSSGLRWMTSCWRCRKSYNCRPPRRIYTSRFLPDEKPIVLPW